MHGGYEGHAEPTEQRKGQPVDVSVDLDLGACARDTGLSPQQIRLNLYYSWQWPKAKSRSARDRPRRTQSRLV